MMKPVAALFLLGVLAISGAAAPAGQSPATRTGSAELFEKEIRPILVDRCQSCHGESKPQAGLRLTSRSSMIKGGIRGPALVPGMPDQSLLISAVEYRGALKTQPTG